MDDLSAWEALVDNVRPRWMRDALCREPDQADLDWVPASPTAKATAEKAVCARCLVRHECLRYALEHREFGIWGGTNEADRAGDLVTGLALRTLVKPSVATEGSLC